MATCLLLNSPVQDFLSDAGLGQRAPEIINGLHGLLAKMSVAALVALCPGAPDEYVTTNLFLSFADIALRANYRDDEATLLLNELFAHYFGEPAQTQEAFRLFAVMPQKTRIARFVSAAGITSAQGAGLEAMCAVFAESCDEVIRAANPAQRASELTKLLPTRILAYGARQKRLASC